MDDKEHEADILETVDLLDYVTTYRTVVVQPICAMHLAMVATLMPFQTIHLPM